MTYCVAMSLDAGMIFASDSRTNAGVDQIATFSKMRVIANDGDRVIVSCRRATCPSRRTRSTCSRSARAPATIRAASGTRRRCSTSPRLSATALREVKRRDGPFLTQSNIDSSASFLVGGQIRGEPPRLFNVYSEGNFIEATADTCYFQIGETKYGKPIIDRVINAPRLLVDAAKCALVSFDSTMRSNISVGCRSTSWSTRDSLRVGMQRRIDEDDPYYQMVHRQWGEGLRQVFAQLPNPDWM